MHHATPPIPGPAPAQPQGQTPPPPAELQRVNAHRARHNLAELMERAHAGESFLLTRYGRPWARLVPLEPEGPPAAPQRRPGRLQRLGALTQPRALLRP